LRLRQILAALPANNPDVVVELDRTGHTPN
jgi:hypothetical protein